MDIKILPCLQDNLAYLIRDPETETVAVIDPSEAAPVLQALQAQNWKLHYIFNTHHHHDHVGGNLELKAATGCQIIGSEFDRARIPGIDRAVKNGEVIELGNTRATAISIPGHTLGHTAYYFAEARALFTGDTLFQYGCGRLFEGTPEQMWQSLSTLARLPDDLLVYCGHDYTVANLRFALSLEPNSNELKHRMDQALVKRHRGLTTIPSTLGEEKLFNPFLKMPTVEAFAKLRTRKDLFS